MPSSFTLAKVLPGPRSSAWMMPTGFRSSRCLRRACDALKRYGDPQSDIATFLELDRTTISKAVNKTNWATQGETPQFTAWPHAPPETLETTLWLLSCNPIHMDSKKSSVWFLVLVSRLRAVSGVWFWFLVKPLFSTRTRH